MKRQMPKVTEGIKALFVLPLITFYIIQSHGLKSAYLKCGRLSIRSTHVQKNISFEKAGIQTCSERVYFLFP